MEKRREKVGKVVFAVFAAGLVVVSLLVFYQANRKTVFQMDDDWYSTNLVTGEPLTGLGDIYESQVWHFFHWGGRSMAHALLQLTLFAGPVAADYINVAATVLLVVLICRLAGTKDVFHGFLTLGLLVILNANWHQTLLWQSGVANYLYMTVAVLLFFLLYFRKLENAQEAEKRTAPGSELLKSIAIIPLGLLAGWSNENMGPAVWIGTTVTIFLLWKKKRKLHAWMFVGNLVCLMGSVLMILAPGNAVRSTEAAAIDAGKGLLWRMFLRGFSMANGLFYYLLHAVVLFLVLFFIFCFLLRKKLREADWICLLMAVLSYGAMIVSPHYPDRAAFGTMVFLLIPIVHVFSELQRCREDLRLPAYGVVFFVWLGGMFPLCTYICQKIGWLQ